MTLKVPAVLTCGSGIRVSVCTCVCVCVCVCDRERENSKTPSVSGHKETVYLNLLKHDHKCYFDSLSLTTIFMLNLYMSPYYYVYKIILVVSFFLFNHSVLVSTHLQALYWELLCVP